MKYCHTAEQTMCVTGNSA